MAMVERLSDYEYAYKYGDDDDDDFDDGDDYDGDDDDDNNLHWVNLVLNGNHVPFHFTHISLARLNTGMNQRLSLNTTIIIIVWIVIF